MTNNPATAEERLHRALASLRREVEDLIRGSQAEAPQSRYADTVSLAVHRLKKFFWWS